MPKFERRNLFMRETCKEHARKAAEALAEMINAFDSSYPPYMTCYLEHASHTAPSMTIYAARCISRRPHMKRRLRQYGRK